jgi:membrane protease YdiL (CAAX protease family)
MPANPIIQPAREPVPLTAADWVVLVVALVLPTAVTWLYFIALNGAPAHLQQSAYTIGKGIQFLLPAVWVFLVHRQRPRWARPPGWSVVWGLAFGLVIGGAMLALYAAVLKPAGLFDSAAGAVREKVRSFGAGSPAAFLLLALFYSAIHSLLEEYYWRWFVFGQLARGCRWPVAVAVSSVGFAAHHVLVLGLYFGYSGTTALLTWLFTLAIVIGGAFWAWLYRASSSLAGPWLSHALIDAAIFAVGYQLITG